MAFRHPITFLTSDEKTRAIRTALEAARGNVSEAAIALEISAGQLWQHVRCLGIGSEVTELRERVRYEAEARLQIVGAPPVVMAPMIEKLSFAEMVELARIRQLEEDERRAAAKEERRRGMIAKRSERQRAMAIRARVDMEKLIRRSPKRAAKLILDGYRAAGASRRVLSERLAIDTATVWRWVKRLGVYEEMVAIRYEAIREGWRLRTPGRAA